MTPTLRPPRRALRCAALLYSASLWAGCAEPTGPERPISGERIYLQNCARCHGPDGRGAAEAPAGTRDLTQPGYMSTLTDERIKMTIRMGKAPNMPAFGGRFAEPSMKVLIAFVRQLAAPPAAPATDGR